MTRVPESRIVGNAGAAKVSCLLAPECLVRPVAADTDIGVDLYCERHVRGNPFLHFWIQVKSGPSIVRVLKDPDRASSWFDADHLKYWGRQPVPVFGALVPDPLGQCKNHDIYFCDISQDIIEKGVPKGSRGRRIRSSLRIARDDDTALKRLLDEHLVAAWARWQCYQHGVVEPLPTSERKYFRRYPSVPVIEYQREISDQVRITAAFTIIQAFQQKRLGELDARLRRVFGQVSAMHDVNHWESPFAAGLSLHEDGDFVGAKRHYKAARACILRDPRARGQSQWQSTVASLEQLMVLADGEEGL